ncbi:MAG TPA: PQQ-dependent sugar dehydrogenase [Candidatus Limnocylindrales bacterium]|nr:PQQ-dependent sugar dehydrogenase [Candidatus Limnocylindrales bacterium]
MLPSTGPAPARASGPAVRLVLVALVVIAAAVLIALLASRSAPRGGGTAGGPTGLPPGSSRSGGSGFDPTRVAITLEPFADGLTAPLAIANAGDGSGRLFVAEQGGRIRIIRNGRVEATPFLDISDEITSGGERGLLGLAFHPDYPADGRIFVDYTDTNGDTQVSSFEVSGGDPDRVDPTSEMRILHVKQPFANHNGGALVFDPGGMLLISLGDGGSGGDPQGNGQSLETLLGKILRIDVAQSDADHPYRIPADNPFRDGADRHRPEIWLWGLRNPWRMSFDRATGDLWIGDVGQNAWEEVDVQRAGTAPGTNFGWNRMEGTHCFQPEQGCEGVALTLPVTDYGHDLGCTVIGGGVYRGSVQTALLGGYVFGDYCSGRVWAIDPAGGGYRAPVLAGETGRNPSAFGEDEAGELFVADIGGGAILRVAATAR